MNSENKRKVFVKTTTAANFVADYEALFDDIFSKIYNLQNPNYVGGSAFIANEQVIISGANIYIIVAVGYMVL